MSVELGLKETQSSPLMTVQSVIVTWELRYVSQLFRSVSVSKRLGAVESGSPVGVLGLFSTRLHRVHVHVAIRDIGAALDKVVPEGALVHGDVLNEDVLGVEQGQHDGTGLAGRVPGYIRKSWMAMLDRSSV
ncbi:glycoside hydrolase family 28 protein [Colletotrichum asianum]